MMIRFLATLVLSAFTFMLHAQEKHRPAFHFSPASNWVNDPNGMYFNNGLYHLFFQYYPEGTKWGPMHWGHATSKDMISWEEQEIALYPDSLGFIFSGSAVVDKNNTSGFGTNGDVPIVAIFTHHDPAGEREKRNNYQVQSLAYSLDDGKTWTKYKGNPVLPNPGITDFRDPKVMWYEPQKKWIMTLATKDRITFFSSPDLKSWKKESEFGSNVGAHGGVWECPDLFPLSVDGRERWVLLVSINPGGPNGGSATQYFIGDFDGRQFTAEDTTERWMDFGTDNYAGVTFSNTGQRTILMGWMSNWQYAQVVPTEKWRGAFTLPRELSLRRSGDKTYLVSTVAKEFKNVVGKKTTADKSPGSFQVDLSAPASENFTLKLSSEQGDLLQLGYNKSDNTFFVDRTKSGDTGFEPGFAKRIVAPRISADKNIDFKVIVDAASIELFADNGLTVITAIYFPKSLLSKVELSTAKGASKKFEVREVKAGTKQSSRPLQ